VTLLPLAIGVLPVLCFLAGLRALDSFKLVSLRWVLGVLLGGAALAGAAMWLNGILLGLTQLSLPAYSRYLAPVVEEALKALVIVLLVRGHRIGFAADAAIFGFAVGAGFATVENLWFVHLAPDAQTFTWVVRGFGTALMHGGATAAFAIASVTLLEIHPGWRGRAFVPGLLLAALLHSGYNHLVQQPMVATLATLLALPLVLGWVLQRSERATRDWLGQGFDADVAMLEQLRSGALAGTPTGIYLHTLREHLRPEMRMDVLCYLRLFTELSLKAKGLLMLREAGLEAELDTEAYADVPALLAELEHLRQSIGPTGMHALRPLLRLRRQDLWQMFALGQQ
jgi:protease PrsW